MKNLIRVFFAVCLFLTANIPSLLQLHMSALWIIPLIPACLLIHIFPSAANRKMPLRRHRICADGCELLILFLVTTAACICYILAVIPAFFPEHIGIWFLNLLTAVVAEAILFWNGIIRVYCTSVQIGLKWRIIGIACGMIPVVNLYVLFRIIHMAGDEAAFESGKLIQAQERKDDALCRTKYPLLFVHGVFFRDFKYFNYWGRIPKELEKNGAVIFYGNHQSAASVIDSGKELSERILQIVKENGCGKVNIIAHSKGGLDCRYAISMLGMAPHVASLTTISTPPPGM